MYLEPTYQQPIAPKGFDHIKRYWDKTHNHWAAKILPGEFYVSTGNEMINTVLGSCISVCIHERALKIGGMNHFMLPHQSDHATELWGGDLDSSATRYGNWAMEYLINEILKLGGLKENFEVKIFGGGQVLANLTDIGQGNILFAYDFLRKEGLNPVASDVGDIYPRKVLYFPKTGKVRIKRMSTSKNERILQQEKSYSEKIDKDSGQSDVELF